MNLDFNTFNSIEPLDDLSPHGFLPRFSSSFLDHSVSRQNVSKTSIEPRDLDVILGRDKEAFNHMGNRRYRAIIDQYGKSYQSCPSRDDKTRMTGEIIKRIRSTGSRFIQKNKDTGLFEEVEDVHEKVSHALRSSNKPKKKLLSREEPRKARSKLPTPKENRAFGFLYHEQQKVLKELLDREGENGRQW